jgi:negative regulator of flagellin synthesis FlgM
MEITGKGPEMRIEAYTSTARDKGASAAPESTPLTDQTDKVELSPQAKEILEAKRLLGEIPDIRTDKVEQLQQAIKDGTYEVKGEQVAMKMIGQSLMVDDYF